ncbi:MAG: M14 family metallocarboxypeptidase [Verrucomicrobiales bacterium]|nr:M14 family metallocarboxypeptidase [Verrucomicrobiales bacterium]
MATLGHSGHDYGQLQARWEDLAKRVGWRLTILSEESGYPVLALENAAAVEKVGGGSYLSAGVHGDECAPVWGLLDWAKEKLSELDDKPVVIFPCLNPYGLIENTRRDGNGIDLNRHFQDPSVPLIAAWQEFLEGRRFDVAVNLHEDYDAGGIYLYELARSESPGHRLLAACEDLISRETAAVVDGSDFENGLLRREASEEEMRRVVEEDLDGWPEAIYLYLECAKDSFTFETPSEMDLDTRIATHRRFLEAVIG